MATNSTAVEKPENDYSKIEKPFAAYESGKKRRYDLLFAVNGGAFAIAKLFADDPTKNFLGRLTIQQLAIGMIIFTLVMAYDIWMFATKMRSDFLAGIVFNTPGQVVLFLISALICLGWAFVAF